MAMITFGTDGWRAVIGQDFIPENIEKVTQAFADLYPAFPEAGRPVVVGYDRRNQSPEAALQIARVLLGNGIPTILSEGFCPTPAVSWQVRHRGCAAGIMVTASHNPPQWNGIKFKESYGGAASAEYVLPIEERIAANERASRGIKRAEPAGHELFSRFDPQGDYLEALAKLVDIPKIRAAGLRKVMVDPLYGSGTGFFTRILGDMVEEIHTAADTNFGGLNPEPIPPYVDELLRRMKAGGYDAGLITDGDADRTGAVDEHGHFITTHEIYCLLFRHAVENKKWTGRAIKSISTTMMVNRMAKHFVLPVTTTPVGFKYISPAMKAPGVLMGGEESGGFGFPRHIAERDGLLSGLLLLELMATTGKTLSQLVAQVQEEFGPTRYRRIDFHLTREEIERVRERMKTLNLERVAGRALTKHETMDGHHFLFEDDSWLLFRASGTEPLIRIYAEAPTIEQVEQMLAEGKKAVGL